MSEKKPLIQKERYSLDAIAVNQKVRYRKAREERYYDTAKRLGKISDLEFKDMEDFIFDASDIELVALKISQEHTHDRN